MVSVAINVVHSVVKPMRGPWDFGFHFQSTGDAGKLFVYDDTDEWGLCLRFLVCPEVSTVFITDVYGTYCDGNASWEEDPYHILSDPSDIEDRFWDHIMPRLFPGCRVLPFSYAAFNAQRHKVCSDICQRATVLSGVLPPNVVYDILHPEVPSWTQYQHDSTIPQFPIVDDHHQFISDHFRMLRAEPNLVQLTITA